MWSLVMQSTIAMVTVVWVRLGTEHKQAYIDWNLEVKSENEKKERKLGSYRGFWWCKRATVKFRRKENIYLAAFNVELCWQDTLGYHCRGWDYQLCRSYHLECFGLLGLGHHPNCAIDCNWLMDSTYKGTSMIGGGISWYEFCTGPKTIRPSLHLRNYYRYDWKSLCLYKLWNNFL